MKIIFLVICFIYYFNNPILCNVEILENPHEIDTESNKPNLSFTIENDVFSIGTDKYYTSGLLFTILFQNAKPSELLDSLKVVLPFINFNENTSISYSLGLNHYTPEAINKKIPDPNDRPYASFLYYKLGYYIQTKNYIDDINFTLGVIGPAAVGEETQILIHSIINEYINNYIPEFIAENPQGWDYQLSNEPAAMLTYQRIWLDGYRTKKNNFNFWIMPNVGFSLGNVYTYLNSGITFQLLSPNHKYYSLPMRIRPSIPDTGNNFTHNGLFSWSIFGGVECRAIAYNIFLDGNTFKESPFVEKNIMVFDLNYGLSFNIGPIQMAYTYVIRSKEFHNQKKFAPFASIYFGFRY